MDYFDNLCPLFYCDFSYFQTIVDLSDKQDGVPIVTTEWIDDCMERKKRIKTENYEIS
jgi:hypothetical protein